jgi:hypothetical protein
MVFRRVDVDNQRNVLYMDPPGGDVGCHEDLGRPGSERSKVALAGVLGEVAMEVHSTDPRLGQLAGQLAGPTLGAREEQAPLRARGELVHDGGLVGGPDREEVVGGLDMGVGAYIHAAGDGVTKVTLHKHVHPLVKGRGEKHSLGARPGLVQQSPDSRQEPEVRHVVRLVHDGYLHCAEPAASLLYEILQPAWAGNEDFRAAHQRCHLGALGKAAVHGCDPEPSRPREGQEGGGYLCGELTGRYEHEGSGLFGLRPVRGSGQSGHYRDCESQGLTATGTGAAEDVPTRQRARKGGHLDGERLCDAHCLDGAGKERRHPKLGKGR